MLLIVLSGILIWSIQPSPEIITSYQYRNDIPAGDEQQCSEKEFITAYQFHLAYPEFIYSKETGFMTLILESQSSNHQEPEIIQCDFALELFFDLPQAIITPGASVIQTLESNSPQSFKFEIISSRPKGRIIGTLWIYLLSKYSAGDSAERTPLFVIPVEINIRSFLGLSRFWVKIITLSASLALFISFYAFKSFKKAG